MDWNFEFMTAVHAYTALRTHARKHTHASICNLHTTSTICPHDDFATVYTTANEIFKFTTDLKYTISVVESVLGL